MLQGGSTAASSTQASDPMEVQQESTEEAAKLKEELAQLKVNIQEVLHGQTIEAAQLREQINFLNHEVAKLKEEVAQLKVNGQVFHEQTIEAAQLREQLNFVKDQNGEVAELMETIKRMQAQIDGLSQSQSSWGPQQWDGYWQPRSGSWQKRKG